MSNDYSMTLQTLKPGHGCANDVTRLLNPGLVRSDSRGPQDLKTRRMNGFDRNEAKVERPMVVRAQHGHVVQRVGAAVFASDDVCNVAGCRVPAADGAAIVKEAPHRLAERGVQAVSRLDASGHLARVTLAFAAHRAVSRLRTHGCVVRERCAAFFAWLGDRCPAGSSVQYPFVVAKAFHAAVDHLGVSFGASREDRAVTVQTGLSCYGSWHRSSLRVHQYGVKIAVQGGY